LVQQGGLDPDSRTQTPTRSLQTQGEEVTAQKQRSVILVIALKGLHRLDFGIGPCETRNRPSLEEKEVSGVLAEKVDFGTLIWSTSEL
jgi:hypothetical protein